MAAPQEYRKLPGRGVRRQGSWIAATRTTCTLWLGTDHLLGIDSLGGYAEDYKRFYFHDVQAITIRRSERGKVWNLIHGSLAGMSGLFALLVIEPVWRGFWLGGTGLFLVLLLINWLRGPTCVCHLQTAVQTEELPSLKRLRTAGKAIAIFKPLIEQAQGAIVSDEMSARMEEMRARPVNPETMAVAGTVALSVPPPSVAPSTYGGRAHAMLFGLLLLDVVRVSVDFFFNSLLITAVEVLLWAGISTGLIMALVKQQERKMPDGLRRLTWGALAYVLAGAAIRLVHYVVISLQQNGADEVVTEFDVLRVYSQLSPFDSLWVMGTMVFSLVCSLALALGGLVLLRRFQRTVSVPPPLVPASERTAPDPG